jgi:hypothetical protein
MIEKTYFCGFFFCGMASREFDAIKRRFQTYEPTTQTTLVAFAAMVVSAITQHVYGKSVCTADASLRKWRAVNIAMLIVSTVLVAVAIGMKSLDFWKITVGKTQKTWSLFIITLLTCISVIFVLLYGGDESKQPTTTVTSQ